MAHANLDRRPTIEQVRATVDYDHERGTLIWLVTRGRAIAGNSAGGVDKSTGYHRVSIGGILLLTHHVVFDHVTGRWPKQLDHINGDKADCRIENLRESDQSQNMMNRGKQANNTSGYKGVVFHKVTQKWAAQIKVNGKTKWLGAYETKEEAAVAYADAAKKHFGEFARVECFSAPTAHSARPIRAPGRPSVEELRDALSYDPDTGILRWKRALGFRGQAGAEAGRLNNDGYRRVGLFGKQYPGHVLAWVIHYGVWPTNYIDHRNNVRDDNRIGNLREAAQSENIANTISSGRNTSGYRGVSWVKAEGAWAPGSR